MKLNQAFVFGLVGGLLGGALVAGGLTWLWGRGDTQIVNQQQNLTLQEDSAIIATVEKVAPSVVSIVATREVRNIFGQAFEQQGGGTGFVINADGLIATNRHVVEGASDYTVVVADGKSYPATVVAKDPLNDFAVLRINARNLPVAELGDSSALKVGQRVVAIGNALGEYQNTVTSGVISAIGRAIVASDGSGSAERLEGLLQTDAAINPGNSGGPLVNLAGQVVGINTAIAAQAEQIGFAIPINDAKQAISSVLATGTITRPMMGVRYIHLTPEVAELNDAPADEGAWVISGSNEPAVVPNGPAAVAGIKENDVILSINKEKITENRGLISVLSKHRPRESVKVQILRDGKQIEVTVRLGELQ